MMKDSIQYMSYFIIRAYASHSRLLNIQFNVDSWSLFFSFNSYFEFDANNERTVCMRKWKKIAMKYQVNSQFTYWEHWKLCVKLKYHEMVFELIFVVRSDFITQLKFQQFFRISLDSWCAGCWVLCSRCHEHIYERKFS